MSITPLTIPLPPIITARFVLRIPAKQLELLEVTGRHETAHTMEIAVRDACRWVEDKVKTEFFNEPHVQAAAWILFREFLYFRRGQSRKKPRCLDSALNLIEPYRKGFVLPW